MKQAMKILIVEDDAEIADEVRSFLVRRGFDVVVASGVQLAAARLSEGGYGAVLTDMHMPDGTGLDVLRAAIQARPVPLTVLMTGQSGGEGLAEAEALGVHVILSKPPSPKSLLAALESLRTTTIGHPPALTTRGAAIARRPA